MLAGIVLAACSGGDEEEVGFSTGPRPMTTAAPGTTGETADTTPTTSEGSSSGDPPAPDLSSSGGPDPASTGDETTGAVDPASTGDGSTTHDDSTSGTTGADGVAAVVIDPAGAQPIEVGMLGALTATAVDGQGQPVPDAAITWRSSDGLVLYIDGDGGLLGVSPGDATITAEADGVVSAPVAVDVIAFVPPPATFAEVYAVAGTGCALAGCHVEGTEAGDLRWDRGTKATYERLILEDAAGAPAWVLVQPKTPRQSYLLHKLAVDAPDAGARMPLGGPPLPAAQAQVFLRWVLDGAPLN